MSVLLILLLLGMVVAEEEVALVSMLMEAGEVVVGEVSRQRLVSEGP